jgi:hypothetical protein
MKSKLTNIHSDTISLFAKLDGIEQQITIFAGKSVVVDTYETKTIRVFVKRGFVTMESLDNQETTTMSVVDANHDEPIDNFHTTETHEAIVVDEDMEYFKKNLMKSLTIEENPTRLEVKSKEDEPSILEIVEGEVEQYVEGGYIKGEWTDEDIAFLKKNYPTKGRKYCSTHLNRNESSVQKKINVLGLKKKKKRK